MSVCVCVFGWGTTGRGKRHGVAHLLTLSKRKARDNRQPTNGPFPSLSTHLVEPLDKVVQVPDAIGLGHGGGVFIVIVAITTATATVGATVCLFLLLLASAEAPEIDHKLVTFDFRHVLKVEPGDLQPGKWGMGDRKGGKGVERSATQESQ